MKSFLNPEQKKQDVRWIDKEVDIWLIRENLKLSFEERAIQHQKMLSLIDELKQIGSENRARHTSSSQIIGT